MKKIVALALSAVLLFTGCASQSTGASSSSDSSAVTESTLETSESGNADKSESDTTEIVNAENASSDSEGEDLTADTDDSDEVKEFHSLSDPKLLQYIEDTVYSGLGADIDNEDYTIENINAVYISDDYLEEVAYNSKSNIFFGYTLEEVEQQFQGTSYVFTLGDDGETAVVPFEDYDDTYDQIIKNVSVGTGVILVCVAVSVISGGVGAAPVCMIFAASAKTGTAMALSSGAISGIFAGAITGIKTKDFDEAVKAAALAGSNGFKWGAITGVIAGGVSEASTLRNAAQTANETGTEAVQAANETSTKYDILQKAKDAETRALENYGGRDQISYLAGKEVPMNTQGATRPDIVRTVGDHLEAVEVKYYNLEDQRSLNGLCRELARQVKSRNINMPTGTTQRICLDVTGKGFSEATVENAKQLIWEALKDIYPNIPIDVWGV